MKIERIRKIFSLSLPIIGGMVSQNVLNLVDTAMVGSVGYEALAAVGIASFTNFMAQAFITGISSGVQALSSRRMGENRPEEAAQPLNGGLLFVLILSLPLTTLLFFLTPTFFPYLNSDPAVVDAAVPYLRARLIGMAAVGMNFAFRGYFNGVGQSMLYMKTLILMHIINISLNYLLIFGKLGFPALGSTGAGIGTTAATYIGTLYYFFLANKYGKSNGFLAAIPDKKTFFNILKLSIPNGIQQFFFAAGTTTLFWIIGMVGTIELAAANVLINITLVIYLPALGFGFAATTFVGNAIGRGDIADAKRWGWEVAIVALATMTAMGLPMLFFPDLLLSLFLHAPAAIEAGRLPLQVMGATIFVEAIGLVLLNSLLGAGDSKRVMIVSIALQWGLFLPAAWLIGPLWGYGLLGIWIALIAYRALAATAFVAMWKREKWRNIEL